MSPLDLQPGDQALQLNPDTDQWTPFTVNDHYLDLIRTFPDNFKTINS